ncbi:hypothetical protein FQA39_LY01385 [Lamprigera yunnana]|nr:hypothetical protein FQA39_LY01385 [Lamprigera yunnana]
MKKVTNSLGFILLLAFVKIGECNPRCYFCDSISNPNCDHPKDHKMNTSECTPGNVKEMKVSLEKSGYTELANYFDMDIHKGDFLSVPINCVKTVIKEQDKEMVLRGCQLAPTENLDVCKKVMEKEDVVTHCSLCNENACNSAMTFSTFLAPFILLPLLKML